MSIIKEGRTYASQLRMEEPKDVSTQNKVPSLTDEKLLDETKDALKQRGIM